MVQNVQKGVGLQKIASVQRTVPPWAAAPHKSRALIGSLSSTGEQSANQNRCHTWITPVTY